MLSGAGWAQGGIRLELRQCVPKDDIVGLGRLELIAKVVLFWSDGNRNASDTQSGTGRPTPVSQITDRGALIGLELKMNYRPLPADHGAPVPARVPGRYGGASTTGLIEITIGSHGLGCG